MGLVSQAVASLVPAIIYMCAGPSNLKLLDLSRAPYVLYGVEYIDLVSLDGAQPVKSHILILVHRAPFFENGLQAKSGFEMCFDRARVLSV